MLGHTVPRQMGEINSLSFSIEAHHVHVINLKIKALLMGRETVWLCVVIGKEIGVARIVKVNKCIEVILGDFGIICQIHEFGETHFRGHSKGIGVLVVVGIQIEVIGAAVLASVGVRWCRSKNVSGGPSARGRTGEFGVCEIRDLLSEGIRRGREGVQAGGDGGVGGRREIEGI